MIAGGLLGQLRKNKRAISPAISTTLLTSAIVVMFLPVNSPRKNTGNVQFIFGMHKIYSVGSLVKIY